MSRTVFVNPSLFSNPRKRGKKSKGRGKRKRSRGKRFGRFGVHGRMTMYRRNAGITPFIQNPLILSNPPKRRKRRSNPLALPNFKSALENGMSYAGGAGLALGANTMALSKIRNTWGRRGAQLGTSIVGGMMLARKSQSLGGAFAGAMMYPLLQDLAADLLGFGVAAGVSAKEADLEALAADLEDVMDEMDDEDDEDADFEGDDELELW